MPPVAAQSYAITGSFCRQVQLAAISSAVIGSLVSLLPSFLYRYSIIFLRLDFITLRSSVELSSRPVSDPITEESLLVLRTLGIQTSTTSSTYLSTSTTRFIPTSQIQDIFIHEAFKGFEVRYYLAIVVQDEGEVIVVFPVSTSISLYSVNLIAIWV